MIWTLIIYTLGVYVTWSWRTTDPETMADLDDLWIAYAWPVFGVLYLLED